MWNSHVLPNLFVIGAAKSGTTSLHHYLGQHPDVFMSPIKEPNYFAFPGHLPRFNGPQRSRKSAFELDRLRREKYEFSILELAQYEQLFSQARGKKFRGESSPAYLYFPGTARRIRESVPDARIVVILRDPVARAHSKYLQMRRDGAEPLGLFQAAIDAEPQRQKEGWSPTWLYVDRGFYYRQLSIYYKMFDRSQIHVILYDDLRQNPVSSLNAIFEFLGVDPDVTVDTREQHNVSAIPQVPRFGLLYQLTARPFLLSTRLQSALPERLAARVRPWARRLLLKQVPASAPENLASELRAALTARFREDIDQLQHLVRRDLSQWLRPHASAAGHESKPKHAGELSGVGH